MTQLHLGDCLDILPTLPADSVDSIVTDPPYGLSFMGRKWDYDVPSVAIWEQCFRVLKPGGHLLAFAGTRTQHRMAVNIEDAGFEIRDMIAWVYGSGFPKSLDVSKAIDKAAGRIGQSTIELKHRLIALVDTSGKSRASIDAECGFRATNYLTLPAEGKRPDPWVNCLPSAEKWAVMKRVIGADDDLDAIFLEAKREVIGAKRAVPGVAFSSDGPTVLDVTAPATPEAQQWSGWGTALKPALEPITVARKPFAGTVAENVLTHGTGAINVDGCRVEGGDIAALQKNWDRVQSSKQGIASTGLKSVDLRDRAPSGRWPANLIHDGSDEVVGLFPQQSSGAPGVRRKAHHTIAMAGGLGLTGESETGYGDSGSAARFFYTAKASKDDRDKNNTHPTVKPTDLMAYLCRLVTPPGGIVLDPFMGSGTTGKAALSEGFQFIGIERDPDYYAICESRFNGAQLGFALAV